MLTRCFSRGLGVSAAKSAGAASIVRASSHLLQSSRSPVELARSTTLKCCCTVLRAPGALSARLFSSAASSPSSSSSAFNSSDLPRVVHTIAELRDIVSTARKAGKRIGFVPTMGALHAGHVSLAAQSLAECDLTLVSIFVNPTQFLPGEDLDAYPRTLDADVKALGALGGDMRRTFASQVPLPLVVFAPAATEMYPGYPRSTGVISVECAGADQSAEGARRPGHFRGVATVVSKLLHIAQADRAYFGAKDGMQCIVVRALVRELNFPTTIRVCPTTRAQDGLALSSRNVYLTPEERRVAPVLFRALREANEAYMRGERRVSELRKAAHEVLEQEKSGVLEYVSLAAADTGRELGDDAVLPEKGPASLDDPVGGTMLSVAYKLGKPRLIDNCFLGLELELPSPQQETAPQQHQQQQHLVSGGAARPVARPSGQAATHAAVSTATHAPGFNSAPRRGLSTAPPQVGAPLRRKVTTVDLIGMKQRGRKISMVTAYTYPSAVHVDAADIDVLLVGDSVGMVELGYDTTLPVTVEDMLYHCKAVARGADRALLVGDLPFGSYESSPEACYATAIRFLKEGRMDCVKLEGGRAMAPQVRALVRGGVAVMGHIGLTPQRISVLGGFRAQGKTLAAAKDLLEDALALQDAGVFALVVECVPAEVARLLTRTLKIPTIGIGAGRFTDGQVLVYHDLLGMFQHAHHAKVTPAFMKRYANIGSEIQRALNSYAKDVALDQFPGEEYAPYKLKNEEERAAFDAYAQEQYKLLDDAAAKEQQEGQKTSKDGTQPAAPADETIKVY